MGRAIAFPEVRLPLPTETESVRCRADHSRHGRGLGTPLTFASSVEQLDQVIEAFNDLMSEDGEEG